MVARCRLKCAPAMFSSSRRSFSSIRSTVCFRRRADARKSVHGFVLPGAGAGGINIIDNDLQNPMVHQMNVGVQRELGKTSRCAPTTCATSARTSSSVA
jgi:hypothetical protein